MDTYKTLNNGKVTRYKYATNVETLAQLYLQKTFLDEGMDFTNENIKLWMEDYTECHNENSEEKIDDPQHLIDCAAGHLTYSNVHFLKNNTALKSDDRLNVCRKITDLLYRPYN